MVYLPLWKIWKSVGKDYSQYIMENKKCSKPPTSDFKLLGLTQVSWWTPQCVASKLPWQPDIRTPSAPAGCRLSAPKPWFVTKEPTENGYKWITRLGKPSFFGLGRMASWQIFWLQLDHFVLGVFFGQHLDGHAIAATWPHRSMELLNSCSGSSWHELKHGNFFKYFFKYSISTICSSSIQ